MMQETTKKKVILMGAISPFCDLVREIVDLNIEPIICDYYSDAPAKKMGYTSYDISTTDIDAIVNLAKRENANGIICAFSDRNLLPAYNVCTQLNLNYMFSQEIIKCLTDKIEMKRFFSSHGYPIVKYGVKDLEGIGNVEDEFHFPVLTKPIDAYGSKGIFLCDTVEDLKNVYGKVLKESLNYEDRIIVEEYYRADEISISAWVKNGKAYITCIYDVSRNIEDTITLSSVSFPSKYSYSNLECFGVLLNRIVSDIGIKDGPVTLQCFIGADGIRISELLCRLAGGSPYLYPMYFGGPNVAKMMISYLVGNSIDYQNLQDFRPVIQGDDVFYDVQVLVNRKGRLHYVLDRKTILKDNPEIADIILYYKDNHELVSVGSSGVVFARVICKTKRGMNYSDLVDKLDKIIAVYDESGEKSSFIRKPCCFSATETYDIDWTFLKEQL